MLIFLGMPRTKKQWKRWEEKYLNALKIALENGDIPKAKYYELIKSVKE